MNKFLFLETKSVFSLSVVNGLLTQVTKSLMDYLLRLVLRSSPNYKPESGASHYKKFRNNESRLLISEVKHS